MDEPFRPTNVHAAQGAQLKDQELVKWLEKKLSDMEGWTGRSSASIVSREMIDELMTCFQAVDPQTKLKLMLSFPHINPRNLGLWRESLNNLLSIACRDPDDWVEVISELYRDIPNMGMAHPQPSNDNQYYTKTIEDMKAMLIQNEKKGNLCMHPRSYDVTSSSVQKAAFGAPVASKQHFSLKKSPKSFFMQKDLEKQCELANIQKREKNQGIISSSVPIKMRSTRREGNNDFPMKGIPTQNTVKLSAGFTNEPKKFQRQLTKREGGAKLLDIGEIPQSLKKRRQMASDEDKRKKMEEKEMLKKKAAEEKKAKEEARKAELQRAQENAKKETEKKKMGVASTSKTTPNLEKEKVTVETIEKPLPPPASQPAANNDIKPTRKPEEEAKPRDQNFDSKLLSPPVSNQQSLLHQRLTAPIQATNRIGNNPQLIHPHMQVPSNHSSMLTSQKPAMAPTPSRISTNLPSFVLPTGQSPEDIIRKHHEATIVKQCQDMLRTANALDDSGREMVLSFMRGNKHNPRPELGHVITLKLSETVEDGVTDGQMRKMKVETFFQMDYGTGEWKRLRKCRLLDQQELNSLLGVSQPQWPIQPQFGQESYPQY